MWELSYDERQALDVLACMALTFACHDNGHFDPAVLIVWRKAWGVLGITANESREALHRAFHRMMPDAACPRHDTAERGS